MSTAEDPEIRALLQQLLQQSSQIPGISQAIGEIKQDTGVLRGAIEQMDQRLGVAERVLREHSAVCNRLAERIDAIEQSTGSREGSIAGSAGGGRCCGPVGGAQPLPDIYRVVPD